MVEYESKTAFFWIQMVFVTNAWPTRRKIGGSSPGKTGKIRQYYAAAYERLMRKLMLPWRQQRKVTTHCGIRKLKKCSKGDHG